MKCPRCQHENSTGQTFCGKCGARLASAMRFASPEPYTPKHLVEKIFTSKAAREGERKQARWTWLSTRRPRG
jgi:hypothetical protein